MTEPVETVTLEGLEIPLNQAKAVNMLAIAELLEELESWGVSCTFRSEDGWGTSLCFDRSHCLDWTQATGWHVRKM